MQCTECHRWVCEGFVPDKHTKVAVLQFCFAAPPVTQFWGKLLLPQLQNFSHAQEKNSAPLLSQQQNVSHQINILLFCYHNCRMFLTREMFCSSATTIAEYFSSEKYCALLLPQQLNVSHQQQNSVLVLPQKYSAVLVSQ